MAAAAPARRLTTLPVQEPLPVEPPRTEPPEPKKRPRDRPRPGGQGRSSVTASVATPAPPKPKRGAGTTKRRKAGSGGKGGGKGKGPTGRSDAATSPIRRTKSSSRASAATAAPAKAPSRKPPARKAPARKVAPKRRPAGVIPIAAGTAVRGAVAVTQLPESGLIHRLTRGRAWIGVLGVLLVGIVALNVVTLSFAASAGKVDARNQELSKENSMLNGLFSEKFGQSRITNQAKKLGLSASTAVEAKVLAASKGDVAKAAQRLAAAAGGAAAGASEGTAAAEEGAAGEASSSGEAAGAATGEAGGSEEASEYTPEELEIYEREWAEVQASEGVETGVVEEAPVEEVVTE
jgi:hypothetical protein